jgi:hypothetical protein
VGIHEVKRAVGERQVLSVALDETSFQVGQLKTSLGYAHGRVGQVNRGVMGTGAREALSLAATPATDFKHAKATGFFKTYRRLQAPVHFVAMLVEAPIEGESSARFIGEP